jgi:hypothetical protein
MMATPDLESLIEEYCAGLEAQRAQLAPLEIVAAAQQQATRAADIAALTPAIAERQTLTSTFMALKQQTQPALEGLMRERAAAQRVPGYHDAIRLEQTVARMVRNILEIDRDSIGVLEQIVTERRAAVQAAEHAEATLAAYCRVSVSRPRPTLINRIG